MARRRRQEEISLYDLTKIERQADALRRDVLNTHLYLNVFGAHGEALTEMLVKIRQTLNILNGRPVDYEEPHHAPFSQGGQSE